MWTIVRLNSESRDVSIEDAMNMDEVKVEMHHHLPFDVNIILSNDQYVQLYYKAVLNQKLILDTTNLQCTLLKWKKLYEINGIEDLVHIMKNGILCCEEMVEHMDERERGQLAAVLAFAEVLEPVKDDEIVVAFDDIKFANWNIGELIETYDFRFSIDPSVIMLPLWYRVKELL